MRGPLSSQSHSFSISPLCIGTPNADRRIGHFYLCAPFGRQSHASKTHRHLGQDSPPFADAGLLCLPCETTNCRASRLAASSVGAALALAQALRAMPATDFYTCRRTSPPNTDSRPKHHNLYSPTGDPPKPGTGTTLLSRGCLSASPCLLRPPGPVLDATLPSFHFVSLSLSSCCCVAVC